MTHDFMILLNNRIPHHYWFAKFKQGHQMKTKPSMEVRSRSCL